MGILNNIVVSVPDTVAVIALIPDTIVAASPESAMLPSAVSATTCEDVWLAAVIGICVVIVLWIVGRYVSKCVATVQSANIEELHSRQRHELEKMEKEAMIKDAAIRYNAEQTARQREWNSEADRIKLESDRLDLRLKEAKTNAEISGLGKPAKDNAPS